MATPHGSQPPSDRPYERWTAQHKAAVIIEVIKGQVSVPEACRRYGITQGEYRKWFDEFYRGGVDALKLNRKGIDAQISVDQRPSNGDSPELQEFTTVDHRRSISVVECAPRHPVNEINGERGTSLRVQLQAEISHDDSNNLYNGRSPENSLKLSPQKLFVAVAFAIYVCTLCAGLRTAVHAQEVGGLEPIHWEPPVPPTQIEPINSGDQGSVTLYGSGTTAGGSWNSGGSLNPSPSGAATPSPPPYVPEQIDLISDLADLPPCHGGTKPELDLDGDLLYSTGFQFAGSYARNAGLPNFAIATEGVNVALDATIDMLKVGVDDYNSDIEAHLLVVDRRTTELKSIINSAMEVKDSDPDQYRDLLALYYGTIRHNLADDSKMGVPQTDDNQAPCVSDLANCSARLANMFAFVKAGMAQDKTIGMHVFQAGAKSVIGNLIGKYVGDKVGEMVSGWVGGHVATLTQDLAPSLLPRSMNQAQWKLTSQLARAATFTIKDFANDVIGDTFKRTVNFGNSYVDLSASKHDQTVPCYDVQAVIVAPTQQDEAAVDAQFLDSITPAISEAVPAIALAASPEMPAPLPTVATSDPNITDVDVANAYNYGYGADSKWTQQNTTVSAASSGTTDEQSEPETEDTVVEAVRRVYEDSDNDSESNSDSCAWSSCQQLQQIEATGAGIPSP